MSNELKSYTRDLYGFWDWASENLPTENEDVNELVLLCKQFLIYGNLVDRTNLNSRKAFTIARDNSVEKFESGGDELVKGNRFIILQKQPLNSADLDYDPNDILNGFIEDTERNLTDSGKS
ncbi:unnamed protein product [Rhizophagus irregularis]|uniref:Uncharacterized protein n=1 Tax=Rhizophagus irregularis TaxID=588596 RepID=A0A915ZDS8_9GLOM|nr:unnamed protein product [Rhizophagus irregularis]CAB5371342.1 unnamed protein product [Rhizophagus irregularis]